MPARTAPCAYTRKAADRERMLMDSPSPDTPEFLRTIIVALVATIAILVAFLAASIICRDSRRRGGERRLAKASVVMGAVAAAEMVVFGVVGAPFAAALGIGALMKSSAYRKRTAARSNVYRTGFALGLFGLIAALFSVIVIVAVMLL